MKFKQAIFFLLLTMLLISLCYLLLGAIERKSDNLSIILICLGIIGDLILITKVFFRFLKPLNDKN
jgi:hypothetical protein